jgi:transcriptional regulator with XRE-family HTH domain
MSTAVAALDARNTVPARLERLGMTQEFFAGLCGISKAELSRLLNGRKALSGDQTVEFYAMLSKLEELVKFLEPMKFSWNDPKATRAWLDSPSLPNLFTFLSNLRVPNEPVLNEDPDAGVRELWLETFGGAT